MKKKIIKHIGRERRGIRYRAEVQQRITVRGEHIYAALSRL